MLQKGGSTAWNRPCEFEIANENTESLNCKIILIIFICCKAELKKILTISIFFSAW